MKKVKRVFLGIIIVFIINSALRGLLTINGWKLWGIASQLSLFIQIISLFAIPLLGAFITIKHSQAVIKKTHLKGLAILVILGITVLSLKAGFYYSVLTAIESSSYHALVINERKVVIETWQWMDVTYEFYSYKNPFIISKEPDLYGKVRDGSCSRISDATSKPECIIITEIPVEYKP